MKTQFKLSLLMSALLTTAVYAQPNANQPVVAPQVTASAPSTPVQATAVQVPVQAGQGNAYEKEVTPLLREISRKKATLELKKLDREIEKLEEEALKAQAERDAITNPKPASLVSGSLGGGGGIMNPQVINPGQAIPAGMPGVSSMGVGGMPSDSASSIKILMIYGFDNQLFAKIAAGAQGGYVVKKGDVMPDGRLVTDVQPNYVEVAKAKGKAKSGTERIFVSFTEAPAQNNANSQLPGIGNGNSQMNGGATSLVAPIPAPQTVPMVAPIK